MGLLVKWRFAYKVSPTTIMTLTGADGSIHRASLSAGTTIPARTHPPDEYVFVLSGTVETGGSVASTLWTTLAGMRQEPHIAVKDVD